MAKKPRVKRALSPYNRHVQREMKAGRSMKQAAASWKSGRKTTRARPSKTGYVRRTVRRAKPKSTGGRKRMGGFNSQKIMKYVRLAALGAPAIGVAMKPISNEEKIAQAIQMYTGVRDGVFRWDKLAAGWTPYLASILVTQGIPKISGIIRGL